MPGRLGALLAASILGALGAAPPAAAAEVASGGGLLPGQLLLRAEPESVVRELLEAKSLLLPGEGEVVRAYVLFDRPLDRVFALLGQTARQGEYRGELEGLATVARLPDGHVDEHRLRILFVEVDYRLRYRLDPERRRIAWELDPSLPSPLRRVEGSWELYAMDASRTLGRLSTSVDTGEALPPRLEQAITRTTLPRTLERCRLWVNADGRAP